MKYIFLIFVCLFLNQANAQNTSKEEAVKSSILTFFDGFHKGDTAVIKSVIHQNLQLQTAFYNKLGESVLKTESKKQFLSAIATRDTNTVWLEKLLDFTILTDSNLAVVWTPYEFYFNNEFSHCGVNVFQLLFTGEKWMITSIVDTRRKENCNK
jgi:hypothetical protein